MSENHPDPRRSTPSPLRHRIPLFGERGTETLPQACGRSEVLATRVLESQAAGVANGQLSPQTWRTPHAGARYTGVSTRSFLATRPAGSGPALWGFDALVPRSSTGTPGSRYARSSLLDRRGPVPRRGVSMRWCPGTRRAPRGSRYAGASLLDRHPGVSVRSCLAPRPASRGLDRSFLAPRRAPRGSRYARSSLLDRHPGGLDRSFLAPRRGHRGLDTLVPRCSNDGGPVLRYGGLGALVPRYLTDDGQRVAAEARPWGVSRETWEPRGHGGALRKGRGGGAG